LFSREVPYVIRNQLIIAIKQVLQWFLQV